MHLDLGLGGAEKLVVNFACGLLDQGDIDISIFTTHHNQYHCFDETKQINNGKLSDKICVYGDWLPRSIFGKMMALCAIVRMIYLTFIVILMYCIGMIDIIILDGISAPIPLLKLFSIPVLFYCHFPDKLLCVERGSILKKLYRLIVDLVEEITTSMADKIIVNSKFTADTFQSSFYYLGSYYRPDIIYPPIDIENFDCQNVNNNSNVNDNKTKKNGGFNFDNMDTKTYEDKIDIIDQDIVFVSLNRYERKKNIELAILAFKRLIEIHLNNDKKKMMKSNKNLKDSLSNIKLVIAGGYDLRVTENVEYLKELRQLCFELSLEKWVIFRCSISDDERTQLLKRATALLYTPTNEHFGIVPLEAMLSGTPVIAVNSGGPLETVLSTSPGAAADSDDDNYDDNDINTVISYVDESKTTGFLCKPNPYSFACAMNELCISKNLSEIMGKRGRKHVESKFGLKSIALTLRKCIFETQMKSNTTINFIQSFTCTILCGILLVLYKYQYY